MRMEKGLILKGVVSGIAAGVLMGIISDIFYRLKLFKSSLIVVDSSFLFNFLKKEGSPGMRLASGIIIHLFTSGLFGGIYVFVVILLGLNILSLPLTALYFFCLWLSMLFIALPVAGQGVMGKKTYSATWLEQLILHIIFWAKYYIALNIL